MFRYLLFLGLLSVGLGSCTINKNLMFKTDQDYVFDQPDIDSTNLEYRLAPGDFITMDLYTNAGSLLLEFTTSATERQRFFNTPDITYLINPLGEVELPVIGIQKIAGMTITEAQNYLEEQYLFQFHGPYCFIRVINRRIMVFRGSGGEGQVIPLTNQNISLIEALALAGGIAERGNASKIKVIRKIGEKQEVYRVDLSTIEGVEAGRMVVQAGDIIYVEPTPDIAPEVLKDLQPIIQLISGIALVYLVVTRGR